MTTKRLFVYDPEDPGKDDVLARAIHFAENYGRKCHIEVKPPLKSREQEQHYHAMMTDISTQVPYNGKFRDMETWWKRLLIDAFKFDTKDDPEFSAEWAKFGALQMVPALNHDGFVLIGEQSRQFSVKLAAGFITWLGAFGAEHGVRWSASKKESARYD